MLFWRDQDGDKQLSSNDGSDSEWEGMNCEDQGRDSDQEQMDNEGEGRDLKNVNI